MTYRLLRPLLFALPPEFAHDCSIGLLRALGLLPFFSSRPPAVCSQRLLGLDFPNPVGLAAGFDKDASCVDGLARLGFGFVEVGTVTPRPQPGNSGRRMFRLPKHSALINRLGFNSRGVDRLVERLKGHRYSGVLGVNIGKNRDTPNDSAVNDYLYCLRAVYNSCDYITVNLSSPNTPELRELQSSYHVRTLLPRLLEERNRLTQKHDKKVPLLVKVSPDLSAEALDRLSVELAEMGLEGLVATNTTLDHSAIAGSAFEGGLSGQPLLAKSLSAIRQIRASVGNSLVVVGVGGIMTPEQAQQTLKAGASLIQVYTGLVYQGPSLVKAILKALKKESVAEAAGRAEIAEATDEFGAVHSESGDLRRTSLNHQR